MRKRNSAGIPSKNMDTTIATPAIATTQDVRKVFWKRFCLITEGGRSFVKTFMRDYVHIMKRI